MRGWARESCCDRDGNWDDTARNVPSDGRQIASRQAIGWLIVPRFLEVRGGHTSPYLPHMVRKGLASRPAHCRKAPAPSIRRETRYAGGIIYL